MGKRREKSPWDWLLVWQGSRATIFRYINWTPKKRKQKEKKQDIVNAENVCRVCRIAWESLEDQERDSFWIGCAGKTCKCKPSTACKHECDWWVHSRCAHIYYENSDAGERAMSTWAKKRFLCQKHMADVKKVGWDKELQQDVVLPFNSKKIFKKVIQKKLNKWKFYINLRNVLIPFVSWNIIITLPYLFLLWFNHPQNIC